MTEDKLTVTELQLKGLTFIQQTYLAKRVVPSAELISEKTGVPLQRVKEWFKQDGFLKVLERLGIRYEATDSDVLTPQQVMIIASMLNLDDKRSKREKCNEVGISVATWDAWMRDPTFQKVYADTVKTKFETSDPSAYLALMKNVESGNQKSIEFYFALTGRYQKSVRHDFNLDGFVTGLLEVLQARIADPQLLETIASDLDLLLQGKPVELDRSFAAIDVDSAVVVPQLTEG